MRLVVMIELWEVFYLLDVGLSLIEVGGSFEQAYGSVFLLIGNLEFMREFSPIWLIKEKRKVRVRVELFMHMSRMMKCLREA